MARFYEPTPEQEAGYREWVQSRPPHVRVVAERFDPWSLYRLKTTGDRVTALSFGEGEDDAVTVRVLVSGEFNFTLFEREVFGINPDDLEPCALPEAGERLGSMMTPTDVEDNIDDMRLIVRPDLWERLEDGTVRMRHDPAPS